MTRLKITWNTLSWFILLGKIAIKGLQSVNNRINLLKKGIQIVHTMGNTVKGKTKTSKYSHNGTHACSTNRKYLKYEKMTYFRFRSIVRYIYIEFHK